jgi:hypothetical protein
LSHNSIFSLLIKLAAKLLSSFQEKSTMDNATMVWHIIIVLAKTGCPMLVKLEYPGQKREKRKRLKEQPCRFRPVFTFIKNGK